MIPLSSASKELEEGVNIIKEVMEKFEEKNNTDKEEKALFGSEEAEETRMLGCWLGPKKDLMNRKKRAGYLLTPKQGFWTYVKRILE